MSSPSSSPLVCSVVHKFGGSSLGASACFLHVAALVIEQIAKRPANETLCVVVSAAGEAAGKATNAIIEATRLAEAGEQTYKQIVQQLQTRHERLINECMDYLQKAQPFHSTLIAASRVRLLKALEEDFQDFLSILRAVCLTRCLDDHLSWYGLGEVWAARLLSAIVDARLLAPGGPAGSAEWADTREMLVVKDKENMAPYAANETPIPDYAESARRFSSWCSSRRGCRAIVFTGYLATNAQGRPTTLGRDGSDYSAAIIGAMLKCSEVYIWSDVAGVYSADPRLVASARRLSALSYDEASELAYFGAKVLHPKTMWPLVQHNIPLILRNTFDPSAPGTRIGPSSAGTEAASDGLALGVKGLSECPGLSLIEAEGTGMIGVPGVASRLFGALARIRCSVSLITQAGSEHTICVAVPAAQGQAGIDAMRHEFHSELSSGSLSSIALIPSVSCLALVGDGMRHCPGVSGRLFGALADERVNVLAIAQGASERNISVIVKQQDAQRGLEAIHKAFAQTHKQTQNINTQTNSAEPSAFSSLSSSAARERIEQLKEEIKKLEEFIRVQNKTEEENKRQEN